MPGFAARLAEAGHDHEARRGLLRELYSNVMTMPQEQVDLLLNPLLSRLQAKPLADKDSPDYWALRAAENFPLPGGHRDRGIFSVYLLNLVHLRPGQGTFQPAGSSARVSRRGQCRADGQLRQCAARRFDDQACRRAGTAQHPYLRGRYSEMSSDGSAVSRHERIYRTPAEEFELSRICARAATVDTRAKRPTARKRCWYCRARLRRLRTARCIPCAGDRLRSCPAARNLSSRRWHGEDDGGHFCRLGFPATRGVRDPDAVFSASA